MISTSYLTLLLLFGQMCSSHQTQRNDQYNTCEPLNIPRCRSLGLYNQTRLPNTLGHETQEEAGLELAQFTPLIDINCHTLLPFFLCTIYAPVCSVMIDITLLPCRSVCLAVRNGCKPILAQYGFPWPAHMTCERFPNDMGKSSEICLKPPEPNTELQTTTLAPNIDVSHETPSHSEESVVVSESSLIPATPATLTISTPDEGHGSGQNDTFVDTSNTASRSIVAETTTFDVNMGTTSGSDLNPATTPVPMYNILHGGQCQRLRVNICQGISKNNKTRVPNFIDNPTQQAAALGMNQYSPLLKIKCSSQLQFFLCSIYAPTCIEGQESILPPCRSVCQAARNGCEPVMNTFGIPWPSQLSCDYFPVEGKGKETCLKHPGQSETLVGTSDIISASQIATTETVTPVTNFETTSSNPTPAITPVPRYNILQDGHCEPLTVKTCQSISKTNKTRVPNFFTETQETAGSVINTYSPLIKIQCSSKLQFFLCSIYAPTCVEGQNYTLPPCKSVCQAAWEGCGPIMQKFGFPWPAEMSCDNFPVNNEEKTKCLET